MTYPFSGRLALWWRLGRLFLMVAAAFLALACSNPFSPGLAGSMNLNLPRALGGYRTMASWSIQGSGPQGATHNQAIALGGGRLDLPDQCLGRRWRVLGLG